MYEHQTFTSILTRMLDRVPADIDKREGSIIYDALAPAAAELAQLYAELDINFNLSFADTASGEYLARRTAEFGITRKSATPSRRLGLYYDRANAAFNIPLGSRFAIGDLTYRTINKLATGQFIMECETAGLAGNQRFGDMLPIDYIDGLMRAELADVLVPGEDEETDESLRQRYLLAINEQPFGGNSADYKRKLGEIAGIGGVKLYPAWQGGGTVKCTLLASDFNLPTSELIAEVQTIIDPEVNQGQGLGFAPIGHTVTIASAQARTIDLETSVTLASGVTIGMIENDVQQVMDEYLLSLRKAWENEDKLIIRTSQLESRILTIRGIVDISDTKLNGQSGNVELDSEEIPILGAVTIHGE